MIKDKRSQIIILSKEPTGVLKKNRKIVREAKKKKKEKKKNKDKS